VKRRGLALLAATAGAALLSGCVSLPVTGAINSAGQPSSAPGTTQQGIQLVPIPPGSQWQPPQIVSGFLAATGATWNGQQSSLSIAREYLTAGFAKHWRPTPAATVIDTSPKVVPIQAPPHVTGGSELTVAVTSQHLARLVSANAKEAGSIQVSSAPAPYVYDFDLVQVDAKWRIASISGPGIPTIKDGHPDDRTILLLENSDFQRDYQPRNLYFPAASVPQTLVPFPVYILDQSGLLGVESLVDGLTSLPPAGSNWLYRSVTTAIPPGTQLSTQVQAHSNQVTVNIAWPGAGVGQARLTEIEAQLVWTLTSSPYAAGSGIDSVLVQIGNKEVQLLPSRFASWVPSQTTGAVYFQKPDLAGQPEFDMTSTSAAIASWPARNGPPATTEIRPASLGSGPLTAVAVSPPARSDALRTPLFAGCRSKTKTVYVAELGYQSPVTTQQITAGCTSLSWDNNGYLWVAAGSSVFRVTVTAEGLQVTPIAIAAPLQPSDTFTSLKVAPDGVRVAMIIAHGKGRASVVVTSISQSKKDRLLIYLAQNQHFLAVGPELTDPISLSWWGPDHLLVLDKTPGGAHLYEVPLNGGQSTLVPNVPLDAVSVAADGSSVAIESTGPRGPVVLVSRDLGGIWHRIPGASSPTYPG
jgi:hypothetical protein